MHSEWEDVPEFVLNTSYHDRTEGASTANKTYVYEEAGQTSYEQSSPNAEKRDFDEEQMRLASLTQPFKLHQDQ